MKKKTNGDLAQEEMKTQVLTMARKDNYQKIFQNLCSDYTKKEGKKSQIKIGDVRELFSKLIDDQCEFIKQENLWEGPLGQLMILAYEKSYSSDL